MKKCENPRCSTTFEARIKHKRFCSIACKNQVQKPRKNPVPGEEVPAGTKTRFGWLWDDGGEPDMIAVHLAVSGTRTPDLTFTEAMIAASQLIDQTHRITNTKVVENHGLKGLSVTDLIAVRLGISPQQAKNLMACVRTRKKEIRDDKR